MGKVISIANNKGGVGKTTASISLAAVMADWDLKVALIDNDPQGNVGVYLGLDINALKKTMADVYSGEELASAKANIDLRDVLEKNNITFKQNNLDLFPSNRKLSGVDKSDNTVLAKVLEKAVNEYDIIIIDNGPHIGYLTLSSLLASDMILIPTEAGIGALTGISSLIVEAVNINKQHKKKVRVRVFVNDFQESENFDVSNLKRLKDMVGHRLYQVYVPSNVHLKRAKEVGLPVNVLERATKSSSRGATAFRALAKSVLQDIMPELFQN